MSQSITDRMSHVMQINELMSDSIEISYHFDELSNVIDSAMHGTSLIHIPVCGPTLQLYRNEWYGTAVHTISIVL
eukprot:COSAG02_NODE_320_length_24784_cov_30.538708_2_plen_75_part_00